ncbi:MAG: fumarylacetoacetate hydrolase family protein [Bacteroidia bacterium]|nr:fumarylacetoacetate hydrolase family protein [Bacteroidia bacterium]
MSSNIDIAAEVLYNAEAYKTTCPPVREMIGDSDVETAYRVQLKNVARKVAAGETIVGKKIGLTSFAVQKQLGVDQPDYGVLYGSTQIKNGGSLNFGELMQPKAEAEIAFVMKKDLDGEITLDRLVDSIDYAVAAIEIVGSRVENWDIRITDTIADNASASHFVLGETKKTIDQLDLVNCSMEMTRNGEIASKGNGKACMDNPLNAALWLARVMAKQEQPLRKGEVLLSGALGPMVVIEQGDEFEATIDGLGSVTVKID